MFAACAQIHPHVVVSYPAQQHAGLDQEDKAVGVRWNMVCKGGVREHGLGVRDQIDLHDS